MAVMQIYVSSKIAFSHCKFCCPKASSLKLKILSILKFSKGWIDSGN